MENYLKRIEQAHILIQQERYTQAESRLTALLEEGHLTIGVLYLMALTKMALGKKEEARSLIGTLLESDPSNADALSLLARLELMENNREAAHQAIDAAIRINPEEADFFAVKSRIYFTRREFKKALDYADKGLALDPQDVDCLNLRSMALVKEGKEDEATLTIDKALAENPENSDTHANYGYAFLHKGDHLKALEHYKTALQIDPMNEFAKAGMLEAMKAKFWPYRMFLQLAFRLGRLGKNGLWAFLIGGYVLMRVLRSLSKNIPELAPFIYPIIGLLFLAFISTWILSPLMNLYMLSNSYGRLTLDDEDKKEAKWVGAALGVSLLSFLIYFFFPSGQLFFFACFSFMMMSPFSSMNSPSSEKGKRKLRYYTIVLAALGLGGLVYSPLLGAFIIAFFAYQWYANYVIIKEV